MSAMCEQFMGDPKYRQRLVARFMCAKIVMLPDWLE